MIEGLKSNKKQDLSLLKCKCGCLLNLEVVKENLGKEYEIVENRLCPCCKSTESTFYPCGHWLCDKAIESAVVESYVEDDEIKLKCRKGKCELDDSILKNKFPSMFNMIKKRCSKFECRRIGVHFYNNQGLEDLEGYYCFYCIEQYVLNNT